MMATDGHEKMKTKPAKQKQLKEVWYEMLMNFDEFLLEKKPTVLPMT